MPTGYTSFISSGNITFKQFALICAKGFGPLASMRDKPLDEPIPEVLINESTLYHQEQLEGSKRQYDELLNIDDKGWDLLVGEYNKNNWARYDRELNKIQEIKNRCKNMIDKTQKWGPPKKYLGLKNFMLEQLDLSLKDCFELSPPDVLTTEKYKKDRLESLKGNISYHSDELKKLKEQDEASNKWVKGLIKILDDN